MTHYYYFMDRETEEAFVVGTNSLQEAIDEALEEFADPKYQGEVSEAWVDMCGFDVY